MCSSVRSGKGGWCRLIVVVTSMRVILQIIARKNGSDLLGCVPFFAKKNSEKFSQVTAARFRKRRDLLPRGPVSCV